MTNHLHTYLEINDMAKGYNIIRYHNDNIKTQNIRNRVLNNVKSNDLFNHYNLNNFFHNK
jgi:hypothetical protein